ncbi:Vacuolar protein sorting-associated protein 13 [Coemansia biformis]|uniref:Vacuolar protein sorting-associated protein 13 n=1 Tax=Coemansia biformis TaxID=1286918 RepID=A0A9W7YES1_9FUNG|nr:Vacuolar protein sorting-associated protein 13 [Coemansia biformis]
MFEGVVATILNRFLGNYVTNLETAQLKLGIWQGDVKLEKLRLKADALDKLRLPVDIKEGWLGTLTISIPWSNLKGEPVRIYIDNVYVLATPRFQENFDPEREDEREYRRKMRRLDNDELLRQQQLLKSKHLAGDAEKKQASFTEQLVTKIVDNLQIVIKNIHVRYEDHISHPGHMLAVGATLGELSAVSTDAEWRETFLHDSSSVIHKLLKLARFAVYWEPDCESMQGLSHDELIARLSTTIEASTEQSILQPVVGVGRLTMNKRPAPEDVRTTVKFEFDQLAFELDDDQYAGALLLTTAFDYAMRQRRYRKHRPPPGVRPKDDPRAWLLFAMRSVYDEVHEHNYRKTDAYKRMRREQRQLYIRLYAASKSGDGELPEADQRALDQLHRDLSYEDIRLYRAHAEPAIRKQSYLIRRRAEESKAKGVASGAAAGDKDAAAAGGGITGWVGGWVGGWVSGVSAPGPAVAGSGGEAAEAKAEADGEPGGDGGAQLSEKQVQELYDTIEFNEDDVAAADDDLPKETVKLAATAVLGSGSLKLKVDRRGRDHTLMGFMFDTLRIDLLQRPQNFEANVSVHRFEVVDGTLPGTQYPRMIYLQSDCVTGAVHTQGGDEAALLAVVDAPRGLAALAPGGSAETQPGLGAGSGGSSDPFLQVHFEQNPLDGHADSVVAVRVRSLNVVYHPTAVKALLDYFEPPSSASAESIHALVAAASKSMAGLRDQTKVGLEYALAQHKTVDVKVDFDAPVFVIPLDMLDPHSAVVVLDTGYLTIESQLVDSETTRRLRQKHTQAGESMEELESLLYDHFAMRLYRTQLLVGGGLDECMRALRDGEADQRLHVVDRIELNLDLGLCILAEPPVHMPKVTVDGHLPSLQVYFSDRKYKAIMHSIDLILEAIADEAVDLTLQYEVSHAGPSTAFGAGGLLQHSASSDDSQPSQSADESGDEFFETSDQIGDEPAPTAGRLQRKAANADARVGAGREPDRITVRVGFAIDNLVGFVWRTHTDGRDDLHIGDLAVSGLAVKCINRPYDLFADVTIHQVTVEDHLMDRGSGSSSGQPVYALTSDIAQADANGETGKNLVAVKYHRCQADHPDFTTTYESIGQTVDVDISYLDLMVVRKTILTTYDYILKTFTDEGRPAHQPKADEAAATAAAEQTVPAADSGRNDAAPENDVSSLIKEALDTIRVDVRFKGTDFGLCHDNGTPIALLSVTAATMRVLLKQQMLVEAKIGNITLTDQLDLPQAESPRLQAAPKQPLFYIKGDELADFCYETFDEKSPSYPGHNAAVFLRLGAAHMTFMERPLRELMEFGSRFSAMHGLFEAARQAAAYGATQLTEEMIGSNRYHFDVAMSAPVITFPRDGIVPYADSAATAGDGTGADVLVLQPGELTISNEFTTVHEMERDWAVNHISLALRRIGIKSVFVVADDPSEHGAFGQAGEQVLQILEDVDYHMDMHMLARGRIDGSPRPVTELVGVLSPIKMKLTEYQYKMAYDLLLALGRVFGADPNEAAAHDVLARDWTPNLAVLRENPATKEAKDTQQALANLGQIDGTTRVKDETEEHYATVDLFVTLATVQLELFQGSGFGLDSMRKASFTRMDVNDLSVKYRAKANGDSKAELVIAAVRAYDTRPGTENQFTQIISPTIVSKHHAGAPEASSAGAAAAAASSMHAVPQDSPAEEDEGSPQLVCHVDMRPNQDMVVLLTLDSPRIILVLDHAFLLAGFATSAFPQQQPPPQAQGQPQPTAERAKDNAPTTTGGLIYKVDIVHPEIIVLADPRSRASEALVLSVSQVILAQEGMFCATMDDIYVSLCSINRRQETSRNIMDPFTVIATMDSRAAPGEPHKISDVSVDMGNLLLRLGLNDVLLVLDIFNKAVELMYATDDGAADAAAAAAAALKRQPPTMRVGASVAPQGPAAAGDGASAVSVASAPAALGRPRQGSQLDAAAPGLQRIIKETMRVTVASLRLVIIRDTFGLPVYACTAKEFHVDLADWSVGLRVRSDVELQASYFNRRNSHWEALVEPWRFALRLASGAEADTARHVDVTASDRLLVNISHAFLEETLGLAAQWGAEVAQRQQGAPSAGERMPYVIINRTGIDCHVWVDAAEGATRSTGRIDMTPVPLGDGESLPWRFEDWRQRREQLEAQPHHLGVQFANGQWEWLRRVQVDREGVRHYTLLPAIDGIQHRVAVEVSLDAANQVKRVVLRSPLVVENRTRVAMEVAMCDYRGELRTDAATIQPGEDLPLPLLFCHQYAVRVRPESGFGYAWSAQYVYWRDFLAPGARTELSCAPTAASAPDAAGPFHVHFNALSDARSPALYKYPFMRLVMAPPLEIENLLPFEVHACVIDRTAGRKWVGTLPRGGVAPVHAVQPGHLVLLTLRIPDAGFDTCEGAIIETSDEDEFPVDESVAVADSRGARLALSLHRMDIPQTGGRCRRVSVYAPYVLVNRTGLPLNYSSKGLLKALAAVAGQGGSRGDAPTGRPLMFSFGAYDLKNRALVRVGNGEWSRPLSFDALGSAAECAIPASDGMSDVHLGVAIEPGRGRYSHTRVVTFTARYVVSNLAGFVLQYRVPGDMAAEVVDAGARRALHTLPRSRRRLLAVACPGSAMAEWSAPFSIDEVGRVHVRLPLPRGDGDAGEMLLRVDVVLEGACLFVVLQREERGWPYRVENRTGAEVTVWQHVERGEPVRRYAVPAGGNLDYAWDQPTVAAKLLVVGVHGSTRRVSLQEIGEQRPFAYSPTAAMGIEVAADGACQVLRLAPALAAPRALRTSDERLDALDAPPERTSLAVRLALEGGIGVSLISRHVREILFATLSDVEVRWTDAATSQTLRIAARWLQVDNQLYGALFPIVLYPTLLGAGAAAATGAQSPPALQAVVVRAKDRPFGVEYFRYASVLVQELSVELDEDFLYALLDFVALDAPGHALGSGDGSDGGSTSGSDGSDGGGGGDDDSAAAMLASTVPEATLPVEGQQLYFELLHLQPFKINISFMRTQRLDVGGGGGVDHTATTPASYDPQRGLSASAAEQTGAGVASTPGVVAYAMNVLTMAIGNVNDAPVSLNALIMQNVRVSWPVLLDRMQKHYSQEVFNQVYKVVGSANLLGNPVGLFNSISSGVTDFFYEPYQGFVMSDRPQDFGVGLARGTASLFKKTVFGMTDSFSKFTDSMSKGLSAATMDPHFQSERSINRVRNRPKHAIYGVARGAESFARSVGSGIAGVVMRPLEGAEQEGVGGFLKGVGKGLVGVVTKPVVGMFDLASNVTEGIRNTTTVFERDLDRQRLPRYIGRDGIVTAYSPREALGQAWMQELSKGAYAHDCYLAHLELPGSDMVVLLTYQRLVMFRRAKPEATGMAVGAAGSSTETGSGAAGAVGVSAANASRAQVEWEQEIKSLHSIQLEATGISLKLPATPDGYAPPGPFIPIADPQSRRWFYARIREAVKALIDQRKELG